MVHILNSKQVVWKESASPTLHFLSPLSHQFKPPNKHDVINWSMSHLCFLTPLHWAGWLPWSPSPDIPVGPLSMLGWLRRGVSLPSSSSQEWLATDRKPLTESSDSDSVGWRQGADARSCQVCQVKAHTHTHARTHTHTHVRKGWSCPVQKSCSLNSTLYANKHLRARTPLQPPPSVCQPNPTWGLCSNERPHRGFISSNTVCSVLAGCYSSHYPAPLVTVATVTCTKGRGE